MSFQETIQLRRTFLDFVREKDPMELTVDDFLFHAHSSLSGSLERDELGRMLYAFREVFQEGVLFEEDRKPIAFLSRLLALEERALENISRLVGKPLQEVIPTEVKEIALSLLLMPSWEYEKLAAQNNVVPEKDNQQAREMDVLLGYVDALGNSITTEEVLEKVRKADFRDLGYFASFTRESIEERINSCFQDGVQDLYWIIQQTMETQKTRLQMHKECEMRLRKQGKISTPLLLSKRVIELDFHPYALAFTPEDQLVILGGELYSCKGRDMSIHLYDISTKRRIAFASTGLEQQFGGTIAGINEFRGNVTVGDSGIIYVNGGRKRFLPNLEEISENRTSLYQSSLALLREEGILQPPLIVDQVIEKEGTLYINLRVDPSIVERASLRVREYCFCLLATNGNTITNGYNYNIGGGMTGGEWSIAPRVVLNDQFVYLKVEKNVIAMERRFTAEDIENSQGVIPPEYRERCCIPSNHCVSPQGIVYASTKMEGEEAIAIKGFEKVGDDWRFVTHLYAENYPGGWPILRSMAISNGNILAYTDVSGKKVHFYEIER